MSINVNVGGNTGPLERDVRAAMDRINRAGGLKIRVDDKGVTQPLGNMKRSADEFSKSLEASNARVLAFGASVGIINAVSNAFKGLVQQTIQVEKNLTDINVVMGLTTKQLDKFGGGLFKVAAETGAGFQAASEAATEFARQGLSVTETLKRTKDALILTRLTGMKAAESVKSLTAAMNTFKGEVNDSTVLVSKFAAVDVKFAVSAEDFAQAIARAGASARDAGVDINELIGVVAAVQERTARGGAVIGNAFKTIFTRLRRSSTLQELENLGIAVRDLRGSTLPAMKILEQLASKYDHLTDSQKSYISQNVAGVFQINMLKAAMADLGQANSVTAQATAIASRATDESTQKNEQLRNTMAALATETGVAIQELAKKIGDIALAPGINKILDGVKGMADFANNLLGDGEKEGNKFAQNLLGGIGNFISGPGLVLITAVVSKLFVNATKYGMQSLQSLLGMNKASTARKHTEQAILQVLANNSALSKEMLRTDISREKKEQMILSLIKQQTVEAQKLAAVSKQLTMPLIRAGVTPNLSMKRANGFIPNFAMDKSERQLAAEGGYAAGAIKDMNIPGVGNVTYNTAEDVKKFPGMTQPAIVPPQGSKAGNNYDLAFQKAHGFSPYASGGFVPNFARPLRMDTSIDRLNQFTRQHLGFTKNSPLAFSTGHRNTFGEGGARVPGFSRAGGHKTIYLDANKVLGEPFMKTMGVMVGQGSNTLQKKNYTTSLMSVPALKPLKEKMEMAAPGSAAKTRIRVGIHEKGLYPVDDQDVNSVSKGIKGSFRTTLQKTPGLTEAMDNLALGMKQMVFGQAKDDVKINKGAALGHVLGESAWRGYMLEAGVKSAFGRKIDTGKESQRAFDLEGAIPQPLRDFMGMPLLRALELKSTEEAAGSGNVANKVFNRIFNDYANGKALLSSAGVTQTFNNNGNGRLMQHMKGKLGMAGGYIPNFANPLLEAIGREREAGIPVSQIRVGSHNALRDKSNPMGIGVTNTSDEPNGLKDVFGANGFVPNYAALRQTTAAGGHAVVTKNQQKLIDQEVKFLIKELKRGSMSLSEVQTRFKNLGQNVPGLGSSFQLTKKSVDNLTNKVTIASQKVGMLGNYSAGSQNPGTGGIINQLLNRGGGAGTGVGGFLGRMNSSEGALGRFTNGMGGMGMMMGLSMGSSFVRGDDPTNAARSSLAGGMESASMGASMGMMFGPLGMAIGGAAGAIYGLVDGFDKAAEAAKKLAEENLAAATSATSAAISFALQNEKMDKTFNADLGSFDINTMTRGKQFAIKAARPDSDRRHNPNFLGEDQERYDKFKNANKGKEIYLGKEGGYTTDINEAKTRQDKGVYGTSTMSFRDSVNSFGGNVGPNSSMGQYINALADIKPRSLEDISSTLGLDYEPAIKGSQKRNSGGIIGAREELADQEAIEAQAKDKQAIVDLRQKFISNLFDTDLERSKTYTFQQGGKDVTKTGKELIEDLGNMDLEDALKMSGQLFDQLSEEAKKSIEQMKINRAQMARRINFERALLSSQSKFADRMYGLNMQHLKQTSAVERTLKLYANSMSASAKSELKFTQQRMGIDKKLNDEKLKAAQAFKEQTIKFLNSDGGTGIGQELKNIITDTNNQQILSSLVSEDFANQINAAKGTDGGVEEVLAGLSVEQIQSLVAGLNEAKLANSEILDFLNQQVTKMKNANEAADQAANLSRKKLDYEIETQRVLDSRVEKLKEINRLLDLQSNAAQFASKAMGLIAGNANLDDQIALARIGGGTASQKFNAKRVAAQRNYDAASSAREMNQQVSMAKTIANLPGMTEIGLTDGTTTEALSKMNSRNMIKEVKRLLSPKSIDAALGKESSFRAEQVKELDVLNAMRDENKVELDSRIKADAQAKSFIGPMPDGKNYSADIKIPLLQETVTSLDKQIEAQETILQQSDARTKAIKSASTETKKHLDKIQQTADEHKVTNKLLDEQFAKTQKLAKIQHDFVYGENSFANGMNKALMEASDRAERFKHDLGYALPQMFADNMTNAMMKISKGESFGDAMLEAGIAFVDEINRMLIKANMDKMLQGILGDKGKSEATLAKEATQGLKQAVEGTLSSEISKLSQSINTLANKIGRGMYQGGAIKKFNSGGPVRMNSGGSVGDFFRAQSNKALDDTVKNLTGSMTTLTQATQVAAEKQFSLAEFFSSPLDQAAAINPGAESKIAGDFRADEMNMRNNPAGIAQDNSIYTGEQPGGSAAAINPGALSLNSSVDVQETKVQEKMVTEQLVQKLNEFGTTITSTKTTLATFGTNVQQISQAIAQATAAIKQAVQEIKMQKAAMAAAGGAYQGGRIPGDLRPIRMNTGGNVPAMLTSGEFVMNRRAVSRLGQANMALLNQGTIPAFNEGGPSFGADFASGIGSGLGSMGMSMALGGLSNWMNEKLGNNKKGRQWERPDDAFQKNRAYKRNKMSAYYMQNSADVKREAADIRMQKEKKLQEWIAKQNQKQDFWRGITTMVGQAGLNALGNQLSSSEGFGSSTVKDSQGNVVQESFTKADGTQGVRDRRMSFFDKADNTLGYKSAFMGMSQKAHSQDHRAFMNDPTNNDAISARVMENYKMEQAYKNQKNFEANNRFSFGGYNTGGRVAGPAGIDRVPAMLSEGEYVINARAAKKIGMPMLEGLNAGKYNEGGLVKDSTAKPGTGAKKEGMTNNISINVTVSGNSTQESSKNNSTNAPSDQRAAMDDLGKKIKQQVITVIREENRPGGLLG